MHLPKEMGCGARYQLHAASYADLLQRIAAHGYLVVGVDLPVYPDYARAAALLRGAELVREAPKEAEPGAKKPFNPFLVSH